MARTEQQASHFTQHQRGLGLVSSFSQSQATNTKLSQKPCNGLRKGISYVDMDPLDSNNDGGEWRETQVKKSNRQEYMGSTPPKESPTGRRVIKRTYEENPDDFEFIGEKGVANREYIKGEGYLNCALPDGFLQNVLYKQKQLTMYDMGHCTDAVTKWNTFFRHLGEERGKELARKWMKDPEIYKLQLQSENRSSGARLGQTSAGQYKEAETNAEEIERFEQEHQKEIDKIERIWETL